VNSNPIHMKTCSKCKYSKSLDNFGKAGKYIASWCKSCRADLESERRRNNGISKKNYSYIKNNDKLCLHCNKEKDLSEFATSLRGLGGVASYCKECFTKRYPSNKEKARNYTAKYRKNNRERYLAQHRIHQFNRKSNIVATNDGSVTDEFLIKLYSTKICYICNKDIPLKRRTADHIIPLSKGGKHSAHNLKMACRKCNSAKGAK